MKFEQGKFETTKNPLHVIELLQDICGIKSWYRLEKELEE